MTSRCCLSLLVLAIALCAYATHAFGVMPHAPRSTTPSSTAVGMFGGLKGAFANDESLGARKNEGLSNGPNYNDKVTVNGKPVPNAVVGQKLTVVAGRVRVKIPTNCNNGDCGTCMVKMNGRKVKACQTTLPSGKCDVQTL